MTEKLNVDVGFNTGGSLKSLREMRGYALDSSKAFKAIPLDVQKSQREVAKLVREHQKLGFLDRNKKRVYQENLQNLDRYYRDQRRLLDQHQDQAKALKTRHARSLMHMESYLPGVGGYDAGAGSGLGYRFKRGLYGAPEGTDPRNLTMGNFARQQGRAAIGKFRQGAQLGMQMMGVYSIVTMVSQSLEAYEDRVRSVNRLGSQLGGSFGAAGAVVDKLRGSYYYLRRETMQATEAWAKHTGHTKGMMSLARYARATGQDLGQVAGGFGGMQQWIGDTSGFYKTRTRWVPAAEGGGGGGGGSLSIPEISNTIAEKKVRQTAGRYLRPALPLVHPMAMGLAVAPEVARALGAPQLGNYMDEALGATADKIGKFQLKINRAIGGFFSEGLTPNVNRATAAGQEYAGRDHGGGFQVSPKVLSPEETTRQNISLNAANRGLYHARKTENAIRAENARRKAAGQNKMTKEEVTQFVQTGMMYSAAKAGGMGNRQELFREMAQGLLPVMGANVAGLGYGGFQNTLGSLAWMSQISPAFQGQRGVQILSQLQQGSTAMGQGEAVDALKLEAARGMGAKSYWEATKVIQLGGPELWLALHGQAVKYGGRKETQMEFFKRLSGIQSNEVVEKIFDAGGGPSKAQVDEWVQAGEVPPPRYGKDAKKTLEVAAGGEAAREGLGEALLPTAKEFPDFMNTLILGIKRGDEATKVYTDAMSKLSDTTIGLTAALGAATSTNWVEALIKVFGVVGAKIGANAMESAGDTPGAGAPSLDAPEGGGVSVRVPGT